MHNKKGFSLIELLVVIAIIAIIAAILFPVISAAREKGRQGACQSNMKQLAGAWLMYIGDYDGKMIVYNVCGEGPGRGQAATKVRCYISTSKYITNCPSSPRKPTGYNFTSFGNSHYALIYGWALMDGTPILTLVNFDAPARTLESMPRVGTTLLLVESLYGSKATNPEGLGYYYKYGLGADFVSAIQAWDAPYGNVASDRHSGGANYAFADGHLAYYKETAAREFFLGGPQDSVGKTRAEQLRQPGRGWWYAK